MAHSGANGASIPGAAVSRPEPYQPANGLEGAIFMASFCDRCARDAAYRAGTGDSCPIAANTMVFDLEDDEYPIEWTYDSDGEPTCTAFDRVANSVGSGPSGDAEAQPRSAQNPAPKTEGGQS